MQLHGPVKPLRVVCLQTNMGRAGIPCMGYEFSIAGQFGRAHTVARGGARSEGFAEAEGNHLLPLPVGYVRNRWVQVLAAAFSRAVSEQPFSPLPLVHMVAVG